MRKKRKKEFSKILVAWAMIVTTACVAISFALAYLDHDPCIDVTVSVSGACIAIAVAYEAKSAAEKHSRNKFGLDRNGNPIIKKPEEEIGG
jgi:hypothetical protein